MEDKTFKQKSKWRKKLLTEIMEADAKDGLYGDTNKMMTAVEWLIKRYQDYGTLYYEDMTKAKAMEKEQIINATTFGNRQDCYDATETLGEQYYNETYQSHKD
jgi:hypothetical protein